jgi:hypothetical protein
MARVLKFLLQALRFYRDHGVKVLRVMTDNGVSFRSLSSRKGVANAENQAQAHQTLYAKNKRKGRTLRADLLAGMGLCQTLQPFIRTGRRTVAFPPPLQSSSASLRHQRMPPYLKDPKKQPIETRQLAVVSKEVVLGQS